ncbi:M67 family peptidase [Sphingomonas glacialis]|uniref:M67 family peptidase n=2 Tax=Sphingomonas glacialis TaxID=658225 RepID=A0A502FKP5_9SPHN|nr:M67 family metallopeptidase [Sphingomonas glacialis]TPG49746.1 M67 family peptidase [Sphingomonas glacialis]
MAMEISSTLLAGLLNEAQLSPTREICGLLFGTADRIDTAQACPNVAPDPSRHFEIDPAALFAAHRAVRTGGTAVIGHYHSHPSGVANPSARDAEGAMGDDALWLIVTAGEARLWQTRLPGTFVAVEYSAVATPD